MRYHLIRRYLSDRAIRLRGIAGLQRLRASLIANVPAKDSEEHLLLATWNIRDLTKTKRRRLPESLFYIAEVISRFDILAIQEVNGLEEWEKIVYILGPDWDYIASDESDRVNGGNGERLTYVFDRRKVSFQKIAGEIVLPPNRLISKFADQGKQFARSPFVAMLQSGWFKFSLCTVHIYFGKESGEKLKRRISEIKVIADYFKNRSDREFKKNGRSLILLGDFNIVSPGHETMAALRDVGFEIPKKLENKPSNQGKTKHYDQIAFHTKRNVLDFVDFDCDDPTECNAGVFDPYECVFRETDENLYQADRAGDQRKFTTWRSYQISDHQPMWVRLQVNESARYLEEMAKE